MARRKETAETSDARRFAHLLFQIIHEIGFGRFERGSEAKQHCRDDAEEERYRKNRKVWPQFDDDREINRREQALKLLQQKTVTPGAEHETDRAAENCEQKTFAK